MKCVARQQDESKNDDVKYKTRSFDQATYEISVLYSAHNQDKQISSHNDFWCVLLATDHSAYTEQGLTQSHGIQTAFFQVKYLETCTRLNWWKLYLKHTPHVWLWWFAPLPSRAGCRGKGGHSKVNQLFPDQNNLYFRTQFQTAILWNGRKLWHPISIL